MTAGPGATPSLLIVGRIRRAHGIRGEVVVEPMTEAPDAIFAPGARLFLGDTRGDVDAVRREILVGSARPFNDGLLVTFDMATDRNRAETLRDRYLLVPAEEVAPPADDEVFLHDLVGLAVENNGDPVGTVTGYFESPAGLLLEILKGGETVLVPWRVEFIVSIDLVTKRLVLAAPEGMFE